MRQYRTPKLLWLIPIIATCGSLTAGVLAAPAKSGGNPYSVSIPIPEAAAGNADRNPAYASTTADHRPTAGAKSRIDLSKARGVTEPRRTELDTDRSSAPVGDPAAAEQHFIGVAMRTGEMQSWQSGTDRNFLIVGEPRIADDGSCRQFSLLRRSDTGEDSVEHFERCHGAS